MWQVAKAGSSMSPESSTSCSSATLTVRTCTHAPAVRLAAHHNQALTMHARHRHNLTITSLTFATCITHPGLTLPGWVTPYAGEVGHVQSFILGPSGYGTYVSHLHLRSGELPTWRGRWDHAGRKQRGRGALAAGAAVLCPVQPCPAAARLLPHCSRRRCASPPSPAAAAERNEAIPFHSCSHTEWYGGACAVAGV